MKWIRVIMTIALLMQMLYVPCAAQEFITLKGSEIEKGQLGEGMSVEVRYYSHGKEVTAKGRVQSVREDRFTVLDVRRIEIRYSDIVTLRFKPRAVRVVLKRGEKVRITASSVPAKRISGRVVKVTANTLTLKVRNTRTLRKILKIIDDDGWDMLSAESNTSAHLGVPLSALSKLEVAEGSRPFSGALVGFFVGAAIGTLLGGTDSEFGGEELALLGGLVFGGIGSGVGLVVGGLAWKKWQEVLLDHPNIGLTSHRNGGLALSASFAF